jgi:hypothetical protein
MVGLGGFFVGRFDPRRSRVVRHVQNLVMSRHILTTDSPPSREETAFAWITASTGVEFTRTAERGFCPKKLDAVSAGAFITATNLAEAAAYVDEATWRRWTSDSTLKGVEAVRVFDWRGRDSDDLVFDGETPTFDVWTMTFADRKEIRTFRRVPDRKSVSLY